MAWNRYVVAVVYHREGRVVEDRRLEEAQLVARARSGDMAAYETLMTAYQTLAFRVAYIIVGSAVDAEDAAQEGFVKAWYALGRFRVGAPFRPWLLQIVANEARNRRKSSLRRATLVARVTEWARADTHPSPETEALVQERAQELLTAVNTLREEERLVVACRYFLSLSVAETAEALGLPTGTVKSRLSRALDRLRVALDARADDDAPTAPVRRATDD